MFECMASGGRQCWPVCVCFLQSFGLNVHLPFPFSLLLSHLHMASPPGQREIEVLQARGKVELDEFKQCMALAGAIPVAAAPQASGKTRAST